MPFGIEDILDGEMQQQIEWKNNNNLQENNDILTYSVQDI